MWTRSSRSSENRRGRRARRGAAVGPGPRRRGRRPSRSTTRGTNLGSVPGNDHPRRTGGGNTGGSGHPLDSGPVIDQPAADARPRTARSRTAPRRPDAGRRDPRRPDAGRRERRTTGRRGAPSASDQAPNPAQPETMSRDTCHRCLGTSRWRRVGDSNPRECCHSTRIPVARPGFPPMPAHPIEPPLSSGNTPR